MRLIILHHTALLLIVAQPLAAQVERNTKGSVEKSASPASEKPTDGAPLPKAVEQESAASILPGDIFSEQERADGMDPFVSEKKRKADEYFKRGVVLYEGEDFASAAEAFQIAYETLPHPAVLGNIAMCYDSAGKIPEAVTYYRRYLEDPVPSSKNEFMEGRLEALSDLVADLRIHCERSCEIRVDGIERGTTAVQAVVMPGTHRVEGVVDDEVVSSDLITVQARQIKALSLALPEEAPEPVTIVQPPPPMPPLEAPQPRLRTGFWFSTGMTVVSLSLVTAFGTMTLNKKADYRASDWTDADAKDKGESYKAVTNAMVGLAGASAVAALLFAVSDLNGRKRAKKRDTVEVSVGPGAGIAISF